MEKESKAVAIALGTFDGLHLAHQKVLNSALAAKAPGGAVCVTFETPPMRKSGGLLLQPELKKQMLYEMGFKRVISLNFSAVRNLSAKEFLDLLKNRYCAESLSCGYDYTFGKNAAGKVSDLIQYCRENGLSANIIEPVSFGGSPISSTAIRKYIETGNPKMAASLLGRPFLFEAAVTKGDRRGRTIGFPTINQRLPSGMTVPRFGVYASRCTVNGRTYLGVTNFGIRPTYQLKIPRAETFLIGFEGDLYEKHLRLELLDFRRPEKKFDSLEQLKSAISNDTEAIKMGDYSEFNFRP